MSSKVVEQSIVGTHVINGRTFTVTRTIWTNGLSFDVEDEETGLCLTPESYDEQPDEETITDLLVTLSDAVDDGPIDSFFGNDTETLEKLRTIIKAVEQTWTFVGHWENDRITVEHYVPGEVNDQRVDTGYWEQGLWADSASGITADHAQERAIAEYENED